MLENKWMNSLSEVIDYIDFLEEERRRCYKELEELELDLEKKDKMLLSCFSNLAEEIWINMRFSTQKKKANQRKWRAR